MSPCSIRPIQVEDSGNYQQMEATLTNVLRQYSAPDNTDDGEGDDIEGTFVSVYSIHPHQHVSIEIWQRELLTAQLVLAFPTNNSVSVCLLRGKPNLKATLDPILTCIESTYGCVFGSESKSLSSKQMEQLLYVMVTASSINTASSSSLEVTFQAPAHIHGLDVLTFTIPLEKFMADLQKHAPSQQEQQPTEIPIVKALHEFLRQVTHLDFSSFSILRITTSAGATISGDNGRCKFFNSDLLNDLMLLLRDLMLIEETRINNDDENVTIVSV